MSRPVIQLKERLLTACPSTNENREPVSLRNPQHDAEFSLDCLLSVIKIEDKVGLLSRVSYAFPKDLKVSSKEAFGYTDAINPLLAYSQVFVVRDLDGDRGYSLRMDTVHDDSFRRERLSAFFNCISQDVAVLLKYFGCQAFAVDTEQSMLRLRLPVCKIA